MNAIGKGLEAIACCWLLSVIHPCGWLFWILLFTWLNK